MFRSLECKIRRTVLTIWLTLPGGTDVSVPKHPARPCPATALGLPPSLPNSACRLHTAHNSVAHFLRSLDFLRGPGEEITLKSDHYFCEAEKHIQVLHNLMPKKWTELASDQERLWVV